MNKTNKITIFIVAIVVVVIIGLFYFVSKKGNIVNNEQKAGSVSSWTCGSSLVDTRDAKNYKTVLIGKQCWMAENINVGTKVAGSGNQGTSCASIQKYCYSDTEANCIQYGGLYQWDQTMCGSIMASAQGICPIGWHVPTNTEQYTLENYLKDGGETCDANISGWDCDTAGTKLKSGGASGFGGLLAGGRFPDGSFGSLSSETSFWSSVQSGGTVWHRNLYSGGAKVYRGADDKVYGFSVRCLKD